MVWGAISKNFSAITELQTPTKLKKKETAQLDKISDQGVFKDFTYIPVFYLKI
jgi:hypothetical protein